MRDSKSAPSPPDEGEAGASAKKTWTKPTVRPLYQIEGVGAHPIIDNFKTGELGNVYRGPCRDGRQPRNRRYRAPRTRASLKHHPGGGGNAVVVQDALSATPAAPRPSKALAGGRPRQQSPLIFVS